VGQPSEVGVDHDQQVIRDVVAYLTMMGILGGPSGAEVTIDELVGDLNHAHITISLIGGTSDEHTNGRRAGVLEVRKDGQLVFSVSWPPRRID
jgi:hypothetical protein